VDTFLRQGLRAGQPQPLAGSANEGGAACNPQIHVSRSPSLLFEITWLSVEYHGSQPSE
jgi:hypothetical protein